MRASLAIAGILFFSRLALAQEPTKYQIEHATGPCKVAQLTKDKDLVGAFKLRAGETYRSSPAVAYSIQPDGSITDLKLIQSSGIERLDEVVLRNFAKWKFKPRASKCGILESNMSVTIDWR